MNGDSFAARKDLNASVCICNTDSAYRDARLYPIGKSRPGAYIVTPASKSKPKRWIYAFIEEIEASEMENK